MNKLLLAFCLLTCSILGFGQTMPNEDFESWEDVTHFSLPTISRSLSHSNSQAIAFGGSPVVMPVTGASGLGMRLETNSDSLMGFVVYGWAGDDTSGNVQFTGGIPFTQQDVVAFNGKIRYDVPDADSAWIIISFKKMDTTVADVLWKFSGDSLDWYDFSVPLPPLATAPDSVVIGFTSENPENKTKSPGSWVEIDEIYFESAGGAPHSIENGSFEMWDTTTTLEPSGWWTWNTFTETPSVTRSSNSHGGLYSAKLTTQSLIDQEKGDSTFIGYMGIGSFGDNEVFPGMAIDEEIDSITAWIKYTPADIRDSATIILGFTKWDDVNDSTVTVGWAQQKFGDTLDWMKVIVPFFVVQTPDSAAVLVSSTAVGDENEIWQTDGSQLWVDDMMIHYKAVTGLSYSVNLSRSIFPNPSTGQLTVPHTNAVKAIAYDLNGMSIAEAHVEDGTLDLSVEPGVYMVQLYNQEGAIIDVEKVVIQ